MKICEKCGQKITHFVGSTREYTILCKICYDEELVRLSSDEMRSAKLPKHK
jgi:formylmethanofuran dehydrogenase subunit E